jgi:outer membrane protein assembly factor BamB
VLELRLEVKEASVVSSGDECTLTETPQRDGWGLWHETYHAPLSVPGAAPMVGAPDPKQQNFRIYYPDAGQYRARVDRAARTFSIRKAEATAGAAPESATRAHDGLGMAFPKQLIVPQPRRLEARDRATGAVLWTLPTRSSAPLLAGNGTDLLLVTDGDYPNREVFRVDLATGEIIWSVVTGNGSVRLAHNQIYLQRNNRLERIEPDYGGTLWAYETAEPWIYVRLLPSGGVLAVEDGKRYSQLNAEDGTPLWTREGAAPANTR